MLTTIGGNSYAGAYFQHDGAGTNERNKSPLRCVENHPEYTGALQCILDKARRRPASKRVSARVGPTAQKPLGHANQFEPCVPANPAVPPRVTVGKYAARAIPIC
jgi:hypothetical protein